MKTINNIKDNSTNSEVKVSPKWEEFLFEESESKDSVDFKKIYVDMAGDLKAGLMLSQIIYWYLPGKTDTKLRIERYDGFWLAKQRTDWWDEVRLTQKEVIRATQILKDAGLIKVSYHFFKGLKQTHIQLVQEKFLESYLYFTENPPQNPYSEPDDTKGITPVIPKGSPRQDKRDRPLHRAHTKNTNKEISYRYRGDEKNLKDTGKETDILIHNNTSVDARKQMTHPITSLSEPIVSYASEGLKALEEVKIRNPKFYRYLEDGTYTSFEEYKSNSPESRKKEEEEFNNSWMADAYS